MIASHKQILTIEEILNRYYYKEWVVEELREIGEKTTGTKGDLILRYLNSDVIHNKDVRDTAQNLLSSLRKQDLKQILRDHRLESAGNRNDLLERVFTSFSFEPYIKKVRGHCNTCGKETEQELHFDNSWKASYRRCSICDNDDPVKHNKLELIDKLGINSTTGSLVTNSSSLKDVSKEVSDGVKYLKNNYWQFITTFVGALTLFGLKYSLTVGLVISVILASAVTVIGFIFTEFRKVNRLKNNDN